jgi:hypothetical protein
VEEHELRIVARREAVVLLRGRRVKDLGGEQRLESRHQTGELPLNALRPRGQHIAVAVTNQELVVEEPAKSRERSAHRRLAETRPLRRPGHVPFLEQDSERRQQVQVHPFEMRHKHDDHTKHSFEA